MNIKIASGSVCTRVGILPKGVHQVPKDVARDLVKFGLGTEVAVNDSKIGSGKQKRDKSGKA